MSSLVLKRHADKPEMTIRTVPPACWKAGRPIVHLPAILIPRIRLTVAPVYAVKVPALAPASDTLQVRPRQLQIPIES